MVRRPMDGQHHSSQSCLRYRHFSIVIFLQRECAIVIFWLYCHFSVNLGSEILARLRRAFAKRGCIFFPLQIILVVRRKRCDAKTKIGANLFVQ